MHLRLTAADAKYLYDHFAAIRAKLAEPYLVAKGRPQPPPMPTSVRSQIKYIETSFLNLIGEYLGGLPRGMY